MLKDTLQYYKDNGITQDFANLTNEYWTGLFPTYQVAWEAVRGISTLSRRLASAVG